MLETNDAARLAHQGFVFEEGTHRWAYVLQTKNTPWFYITHEYLNEDAESELCKQQIMVSEPSYLLELISTDSDTAYVLSIQYVIPPWLSNEKEWSFGTVKSIRKKDENPIYVLSDGRVFPDEMSNKVDASEILWNQVSF
jgi:hypothetical protein